MMAGLSIIDGSVIVGIAGGIVALGKYLIDIRRDVNKLHRAVYGDDGDDTRDGLAVEQDRGFTRIAERLDEIEHKMDDEFEEAERERTATADKVDELSESFEKLTAVLSRTNSLEHVDLIGRDYPSSSNDDNNA